MTEGKSHLRSDLGFGRVCALVCSYSFKPPCSWKKLDRIMAKPPRKTHLGRNGQSMWRVLKTDSQILCADCHSTQPQTVSDGVCERWTMHQHYVVHHPRIAGHRHREVSFDLTLPWVLQEFELGTTLITSTWSNSCGTFSWLLNDAGHPSPLWVHYLGKVDLNSVRKLAEQPRGREPANRGLLDYGSDLSFCWSSCLGFFQRCTGTWRQKSN